MAQKAVRGMVIQGKRLAASSIQLLASSLDAKKLCYEYDERQAPGVTQITEEAPTELPPLSSPPSLPQAPNVSPISASKIVIEDVALSRVQIVQALVARKLKTAIAQLPTSKSIKDLSGGMAIFPTRSSTLCLMSSSRSVFSAERARGGYTQRVQLHPGCTRADPAAGLWRGQPNSATGKNVLRGSCQTNLVQDA